jgi:hypothetical protein
LIGLAITDSVAIRADSVNSSVIAGARERISQNPSQTTIAMAVVASVWNVFSRQRAIVDPTLPASSMAASVTP